MQCFMGTLPGMNIVCFCEVCVPTSCLQWSIRFGKSGGSMRGEGGRGKVEGEGLHEGRGVEGEGLHEGRWVEEEVHCILKGLFVISIW